MSDRPDRYIMCLSLNVATWSTRKRYCIAEKGKISTQCDLSGKCRAALDISIALLHSRVTCWLNPFLSLGEHSSICVVQWMQNDNTMQCWTIYVIRECTVEWPESELNHFRRFPLAQASITSPLNIGTKIQLIDNIMNTAFALSEIKY